MKNQKKLSRFRLTEEEKRVIEKAERREMILDALTVFGLLVGGLIAILIITGLMG